MVDESNIEPENDVEMTCDRWGHIGEKDGKNTVLEQSNSKLLKGNKIVCKSLCNSVLTTPEQDRIIADQKQRSYKVTK